MTTPRTLKITTALALIAATLAACGGGGPSDAERDAARDGATQCAKRIKVSVTDAPPSDFKPEDQTPNTAAPLIGFAGEPPVALGYRSADRRSVAFAVVPASHEPGRATSFDAATELEGTAWLLAPIGRVIAVRRCLGGSRG